METHRGDLSQTTVSFGVRAKPVQIPMSTAPCYTILPNYSCSKRMKKLFPTNFKDEH